LPWVESVKESTQLGCLSGVVQEVPRCHPAAQPDKSGDKALGGRNLVALSRISSMTVSTDRVRLGDVAPTRGRSVGHDNSSSSFRRSAFDVSTEEFLDRDLLFCMIFFLAVQYEAQLSVYHGSRIGPPEVQPAARSPLVRRPAVRPPPLSMAQRARAMLHRMCLVEPALHLAQKPSARVVQYSICT